ncbi:hypothetical protein BGX27_003500 [Mortierella sp. AM989]|nr:hypothetical protein BGX27_003500 [Mortierella sp. AM989]
MDVVDLLESYGSACTKLVSLRVESEDDPPRPDPRLFLPAPFRGFDGNMFGLPVGNLFGSRSSSFGAPISNNLDADTLLRFPRKTTYSDEDQIFESAGEDSQISQGLDSFGSANSSTWLPANPCQASSAAYVDHIANNPSNAVSSTFGPTISSELVSSGMHGVTAQSEVTSDPNVLLPHKSPSATSFGLIQTSNAFPASFFGEMTAGGTDGGESQSRSTVFNLHGGQLSPWFYMEIRNHCLQLDKLHLERSFKVFNTDRAISDVIEASAGGWKSLHIPFLKAFGPLSAEALLKHSSSLEILYAPGCPGLTSRIIQDLLCSAPTLKDLDVLDKRSYGEYALELDAPDIIRSRWVCDKLEVLKIKITGIPRPDIRTRTNKRPLTGPLHEGRIEDSFSIQRRVYSQLGAMTCLKELTLGLSDRANHHFHRGEEEKEGEYYNPEHIQSWRQYECLSFTMASGMDGLRDLKMLERLDLQGMSVGFGGIAEQMWVKDNWPALKYA